jgi:hypothetical protein
MRLSKINNALDRARVSLRASRKEKKVTGSTVELPNELRVSPRGRGTLGNFAGPIGNPVRPKIPSSRQDDKF